MGSPKKTTLFTGRVFMCLSINENEDYDCMRDFFTIGSYYHEVKSDIDGVNLCDGNDLLIEGMRGLPLYVDKHDFALMLDLTLKCKEILDGIR